MSDNNLKENSSRFDIKVVLDTVENALKAMKELPKALTQAPNNLSSIYEAVVELTNINIDEISAKIANKEIEVEEGVLAWGNECWCLYGCAYDVPEAVIPILNEVYKNAKTNSSDNTQLDAEIMYYLTESNAINNSINNIKHNLSPEDVDKINEALYNFDNEVLYLLVRFANN